MVKKISDVLLKIFAYGVLIALFLGALAVVGFAVAMIIGGQLATDICVFIHKSYFPWVIVMTSVSALLGLVGMYLSKIKALTAGDSATPKEEEQ